MRPVIPTSGRHLPLSSCRTVSASRSARGDRRSVRKGRPHAGRPRRAGAACADLAHPHRGPQQHMVAPRLGISLNTVITDKCGFPRRYFGPWVRRNFEVELDNLEL